MTNQVYSIAIHGGAGTILQTEITAEQEEAYKNALQQALDAGYKVLQNGGTAIDAVKASVVALENDIHFNAGRGSVFTSSGTHEMDASIMDGKTLAAGAVAAVSGIKNPVLLAAEIMQNSLHVILCGSGAAEFAKQQGLATEPDDYFYSAFRYNQWQQLKGSTSVALDHNVSSNTEKDKKFGTVGAVACDQFGNIAAATSTGGMTNKSFGRIGDTPIIGAGTYADNNTCAISCTGHGEPFIRAVAAFSVSTLMEHKGMNLHDAMKQIVHTKLVNMEGEGGMIGVDTAGNIAMQFNSEGMYRAMKDSSGRHAVEIYKD